MFSDESSFTVRPIHFRKIVWRKEGTRFRTSNLIPTFNSCYVPLSIWGVFLKQGRTDILRIHENLNQHKYKQIMSSYVILFASTKHQRLRNFLFHQDGCGPHRVKSIKHYLDAEKVRVLPWPAQSSYINLIENIRSILKKELRERSVHPSNTEELFEVLCNIWSALPDSLFSTQVDSITRKVTVVPDNEGRPTKY